MLAGFLSRLSDVIRSRTVGKPYRIGAFVSTPKEGYQRWKISVGVITGAWISC